jgi:serine/threonine-protein kinase
VGYGVQKFTDGIGPGSDGSAREPFAPGTVCEGRYRILGRLNTSGAAVVYEAEHLFTGGHLALKALIDHAGAYHERMRLEARALAEIRHPCVIPVTDGGVTFDGIVWFATELLSGHTLREELRRTGALGVERAVRFGLQIAQGVAAAHALGIIHRDLKPENIFVVEADDTIRVFDFGLSKFTRASLPTVDRFRPLGSAAYMSPEHLQADTVDERTDVYALGHILYEMIAGAHCLSMGPGPLDFPPADDLSFRQMHQAPPPLVDRAPGTPDDVARCVHQALAKDKAARQPSMSALADELLTALTRLQKTGMVPPPIQSAGGTLKIAAAVPKRASSSDAQGCGAAAPGVGRTVPLPAAETCSQDTLVPRFNRIEAPKGSGATSNLCQSADLSTPSPLHDRTLAVQTAAPSAARIPHPVRDGGQATGSSESRSALREAAPRVWSLAAAATLASLVALGLGLLLRQAMVRNGPGPEPVKDVAPTR